MAKVFEDYFMELQTDMVDIALEYVEDRAEMIYIYCSRESDILYPAPNVFYMINNKVLHKHRLNDALSEEEKRVFSYNVSRENQRMLQNILAEDLNKIAELCNKHNKPMPTEMKLVYNVAKNSLTVDYKYEPQYSNHPTRFADDIFIEWYEAVKKECSEHS